MAVLVAFVAAVFASGCGSDPPPVGGGQPGAPTAAVGADGRPVSSLCDLLTGQDFTTITGKAATAPETRDVTQTSASCLYGDNMQLTVRVVESPDEAAKAFQAALASGPFKTVKQGVVGGVDESAFGTSGDAASISLRRLRLLAFIIVPGVSAQAEATAIQLAGTLLSRANALGT
jgi:hypothetical protein